MKTSRVSRAKSANGCWGKSHELLRHQSRLRRARRGLAPCHVEAGRVSQNPARQRIRRRPRRRSGRGGTDDGGLRGQTGPVAFGVQAPVLGAQIRLGKIRRHLRRVLARQARAVAVDDHGLVEGREQSVAQEFGGQPTVRRRDGDGSGSIHRRCRRRSRRRRPHGRGLTGRQSGRDGFPQAGRSRANRAGA